MLIALVALVVFFSLSKPDAFPTHDNILTMLQLASPLAIIAFGVTVPLASGDFDLSIAAMMSFTSGLAVTLMIDYSIPWPLAVVLTILVGAAVGALSGFAIAFLGASSFIMTLAAGQLLDGGQLLVIDQKTIFDGIPVGFTQLTSGNRVIYIAVAVGVLLWLFLAKSEAGRYVYAIGINRRAAHFAGVRVKFWRLMCFAVAAAGATMAGLALTSQAASVSPGFGTPYLLPVYAAAFLGSVVGRPGQFTILGTAIGVVFLQVLQTGLAMFSLPGPAILIIQGGVLAGAILFSQLGKRMVAA